MGKMMDQGPVLIITFQAQLVMVIRNTKGEVVEGDPVSQTRDIKSNNMLTLLYYYRTNTAFTTLYKWGTGDKDSFFPHDFYHRRPRLEPLVVNQVFCWLKAPQGTHAMCNEVMASRPYHAAGMEPAFRLKGYRDRINGGCSVLPVFSQLNPSV